MKKMYFLAALAVIAAGCAKEAKTPAVEEFEETPEVVIEPSSVVFTAGIDTKAVLDGEDVKWAAGDAITIWNGTAAEEFTTADSGASATFTTAGAFAETGTYTALYPHDGSADFSDPAAVATTLPAAQTAVVGTFDPAANLAVASSTTTSLTFYNLVSYLKFTVPTGMNDLTSVSFKGNAGQKVAGAATVNVDTKALTATGSETATLSGTFAEGKTYYLAIAPQRFATGYTVTITRTGGTYTMVSSKDVTFSRATARNIGNLWDGSYVITGTALDAPVTATKTVGPRSNSSAALKEYTYGFSGNLRAGTVSVKKAYSSTAAATATVPSAGWYHLFYNETTDTFKLYDQELKVNFGSAEYTSAMESISSTAADSSANMTDQDGKTSHGVSVVLGSGFTGTTNDSSYKNNDSWNFWIEDYAIPSGLLASTLITTGTATVTVSGLDPSAKYDFRISGARFNGTNSARETQLTIGESVKTFRQGVSRSADSETQFRNASTLPFRNQVVLFEDVTPDSTGKVTVTIKQTILEACIGFMFVSRVVE